MVGETGFARTGSFVPVPQADLQGVMTVQLRGDSNPASTLTCNTITLTIRSISTRPSILGMIPRPPRHHEEKKVMLPRVRNRFRLQDSWMSTSQLDRKEWDVMGLPNLVISSSSVFQNAVANCIGLLCCTTFLPAVEDQVGLRDHS